MTDQATFCATLVDEWMRAGVGHAVVAPGSRSTPMALALAANNLKLHVHHDERAVGFVAVGIGAVSGRPAVVLTTSGTAAAELHPAILEAGQAAVPLIACTADRPPELQDIGAPQTIDQTHLFGSAVRWFCQPGVADAAGASGWRSVAARAVAEALGSGGRGPGPVHLNLAFRDPLVGDPGPLPPGRADGEPWHRAVVGAAVGRDVVDDLGGLVSGRRGVILAGAGAGDPAAVHALAETLGWPVLADPRGGARLPLGTTVAHGDALLRVDAWACAHRPDVVLRLGAPHASRVVSEWLADVSTAGAEVVAVIRAGGWLDPERVAARVVRGDPGSVVTGLLDGGPAPAPERWLTSWIAADQLADDVIGAVLDSHAEPTEPAVARTVVESAPNGSALVVASSMPIRDVEWYAAPREGVTVVANRGANGIDGVVSTAVGVGLGGGVSTTALVGDLAFLYDAGVLAGPLSRSLDLTVVVVDNDGGGIFSFLPQADMLPADRFERLFGTPHGMAVDEVAAGLGVPSVTVVRSAADLAPALAAARASAGVAVVVVRTDRRANVSVHSELHAAVAEALR